MTDAHQSGVRACAWADFRGAIRAQRAQWHSGEVRWARNVLRCRDTLTIAHINRVATSVPSHDVHSTFVAFARAMLPEDRGRAVFDRLVPKSQISHRYSVLPKSSDAEALEDVTRVYQRGQFPSTARRMELYEAHAPALAVEAVRKLRLQADHRPVTHLVVTSCTGMVAPGLDLEVLAQCGLASTVERTMIGFMGCYAAINALKFARHVVRSEPKARVLVLNLELCTLHMQETHEIEQMLSFLVFGDGCAASLISADTQGFAMDRFHAELVPETQSLITWKVRDQGFDMFLSGRVPEAISVGLRRCQAAILDGAPKEEIELWAVHPGGRSVLDAVHRGLGLPDDALVTSRGVLDDFGNMSSATVMFVLERMLADAPAGARGCAMAFGPGLTAETMQFHKV